MFVKSGLYGLELECGVIRGMRTADLHGLQASWNSDAQKEFEHHQDRQKSSASSSGGSGAAAPGVPEADAFTGIGCPEGTGVLRPRNPPVP